MRRELELLKRSGREKMKSPCAVVVGGATRPTSGQGNRHGKREKPTSSEGRRQEWSTEMIGGKESYLETYGGEFKEEQDMLAPNNRETRKEGFDDKSGKHGGKENEYYQRTNAEVKNARQGGGSVETGAFRGSFLSRSTSPNH